MQDRILYDLKKFREQLFNCFSYRSDATMELIDSLCSNTTADSVVKLSLNTHFTRTYNSIRDAIANFNMPDFTNNFKNLLATVLPSNKERKFHLFGLDATSISRPYAECLPDRSMVHCISSVKCNRPITMGHKYSILGYLPSGCEQTSWLVPMSTQRIPTSETDLTIGSAQINSLMANSKLPFKDSLTVGVYDCYYSNREFIIQQYQHKNLISISRVRSNSALYYSPPPEELRYKHRCGHELWYGKKFKLNDESTWTQQPRQYNQAFTTRTGKEINLEISMWSNILMQGTRAMPMYQYPFTLVRVKAMRENGQPYYKKPLWLIVYGHRRGELTATEIFQSYCKRFDLEHYFRFCKNKLLMNKFQTTVSQHEENWCKLVSIAYCQLYMAKALVENVYAPWEKYLPNIKKSVSIKSPSQVQKSFSKLIVTIGTPAKTPKPRGSSLGRLNGYKPPAKKKLPLVIKKKKRVNLQAA